MCNAFTWEDFVAACKRVGEVLVFRKASMNAMEKFKFLSDNDVLNFISEEAFDEFEPKKPMCRPLAEDHMKSQGAPVHSFKFRIGQDFGYLAIFRTIPTQKWILKSFDKDELEAAPLTAQLFAGLKLPEKKESSDE